MATARPRPWLETLLDSVVVRKGVLPLWVPIAAVVASFALGAALFGVVVGLSVQSAEQFAQKQADREAERQGVPIPMDDGPPSNEAETQAPPPKSLLERAAEGDTKALVELADKEERTANEALALGRGRIAERQQHAAQLRDKVIADPTLAKDEAVIEELIELGRDDNTAVEALAAIASLPGPISADLLYEIWTGTPERTDATQLAETLVYSQDVLPKASDALKVALDLRAAETCEDNKEVLERAVEQADRRSLHLVGYLLRKWGCGANKRQDCNECLRDSHGSTLIKDAMKRARKNAAPNW